jgi:lipopolysaccharide heptosyltransferase II
MMCDLKKILVLCLAGAGDVLMATPLLKELRAAFPASQIDVIVMQGAAARDVLCGNPNVNTVYLHDFRAERLFRNISFCLKLRGIYDLSINAYPQNRIEYNLLAWLIGARQRVGFHYAVRCGAMEHLFQTHTIPEDESMHVVDNNLRIIPEVLGFSLSQTAPELELFPGEKIQDLAIDFIKKQGLDDKILIGFHPGSGVTKNLILKRWPVTRWAELAKHLCMNDETRILLFGTPDEQNLRDEIRCLAGEKGKYLIEAGGMALMDSAALIGRLKLLVCCDALLSHVAAAMQTPSVVLFGPTPEYATRPYASRCEVVRLDLACSPCYRFSTKGIHCTNEEFLCCMRSLSGERVMDSVRRLLV